MSLVGADVSGHQPDLNGGAVEGDFLIIKATQGMDYVSSVCDSQYQAAKAAGKLLGVYHYAGGEGTPQQEADFFLSQISGYIGEAIPILDWESGDNAAYNNAAWALTWLDYVYEKTGVKPMIYMNISSANGAVWSAVVNSDYALWLAYYSYGRVGWVHDAPIYSVPYWPSIAMVQYTDDGLVGGYGATLDLNCFFGDRAAWIAYAGGSAPVQTEKTPPTGSNVRVDRNPVYGDHFGVWVDNVTDTESGIDSVMCAVWTAGNGQDDLRWYTMSKSPAGVADQYAVSVDLKKHGLWNDVYNCHVYARDKAGNMALIGKTQTTVKDRIPAGQCMIETDKSRIVLPEMQNVRITNVQSEVDLEKVNVACYLEGTSPVWNDKPAEKQADGSYLAEIDMSKRGSKGGKFKVDVYGYHKDSKKNVALGSSFFYAITQADRDAEQDAVIESLKAQIENK